jgi:hypothetical protein
VGLGLSTFCLVVCVTSALTDEEVVSAMCEVCCKHSASLEKMNERGKALTDA